MKYGGSNPGLPECAFQPTEFSHLLPSPLILQKFLPSEISFSLSLLAWKPSLYTYPSTLPFSLSLSELRPPHLTGTLPGQEKAESALSPHSSAELFT